MPVPQTDTGGRGENPKTNGRTLVKELGKMTEQTGLDTLVVHAVNDEY